MGRSIAKYTDAAKKAGIIDLTEDVEIIKYSRQIKRKLKEVQKNRGKYLLVVTGHQAEPKAALSRMVEGELPFKFEPEDHVIFSCTIIPTEMNYNNRNRMEQKLKSFGVRIFKDIHVSGHAAREDLRDLINLVKPKNIIPAHGNFRMTTALVDLARDMGYESENIHLLQNGERLKF
jgi:ribonuclease J